jgi:hypothetical protein
MVDTHGIAAADGTVAVASRAGEVWMRARDGAWRQFASELAGVECVAVV